MPSGPYRKTNIFTFAVVVAASNDDVADEVNGDAGCVAV